MAELTGAETTTAPCCSPEQQASCCEPSAKAGCCGHGDGCDCAHRVHTQASSAIIRARKPVARMRPAGP
jgi:hypothetical protein